MVVMITDQDQRVCFRAFTTTIIPLLRKPILFLTDTCGDNCVGNVFAWRYILFAASTPGLDSLTKYDFHWTKVILTFLSFFILLMIVKWSTSSIRHASVAHLYIMPPKHRHVPLWVAVQDNGPYNSTESIIISDNVRESEFPYSSIGLRTIFKPFSRVRFAEIVSTLATRGTVTEVTSSLCVHQN